MKNEELKLELIEWLTKIDDKELLDYLKLVKDANSKGEDWWNELPDYVRQGINRSIEDKKNNRLTSHEEVERKYGLGL